jgi:hypothetical protein
VTGHVLKRYRQRCRKWRHGSGYAYARTRIVGDKDDEGPRLALTFADGALEAGGCDHMLPLPAPSAEETAASQVDAGGPHGGATRGAGERCRPVPDSQGAPGSMRQGATGAEQSTCACPVPEHAAAEQPQAFVTLDQIAEQQQMQQTEMRNVAYQPAPMPPPAPPPPVTGGLAPRSGLYAPPRASSAAGSERRGRASKGHAQGGYNRRGKY